MSCPEFVWDSFLLSFSFSESTPRLLEGNFNNFYPSESLGFSLKSGNKIYISSGCGERINPVTKKKAFYNGMDIVPPAGTSALSASDGIVTKENHQFVQGKGYGRFVIIDHQNGFSSLYSQMDSYSAYKKQIKGDRLIPLSFTLFNFFHNDFLYRTIFNF